MKHSTIFVKDLHISFFVISSILFAFFRDRLVFLNTGLIKCLPAFLPV